MIRDFVYLRFSWDVVRNLHLLEGAKDLDEAFFLFRDFLSDYDFSSKPRFFRALTGVPYDLFQSMDATAFFDYSRAILPRERVEAEFDCGMIGFRWILRYLKCWIRFKLKRNYR